MGRPSRVIDATLRRKPPPDDRPPRRLVHVLLSSLALLSTVAAVSPFPTSEVQYRDREFRHSVDSAIDIVRRTLDRTRSPRYASWDADAVDHTYGDKYALTEALTGTALAASLTALERLGLDTNDALGRCRKWAGGDRPVTLRFERRESCDFAKEETVEIETAPNDGRRVVVVEEEEEEEDSETRTGEKKKTRKATTTSSRVVTKLQEYHWNVRVQYRLLVYPGTDPRGDEAMELVGRHGNATMVVRGQDGAPYPNVATPEALEVDITWLVEQMSSHAPADDEATESAQSIEWDFSIDRSKATCRTPRRNDDVKRAEEFFRYLRFWSDRIAIYLRTDLGRRVFQGGPALTKQCTSQGGGENCRHTPTLLSLRHDDVFVPVLPLFVNNTDEDDDSSSSPVLRRGDIELLLREHARSLDAKLSTLRDDFPSGEDTTELISATEASIVVVAMHVSSIHDTYRDGLDAIEQMLHAQLAAAIGKTIRPSDFDEFLRHHVHRMFREPFVPTPFSYAVRRPGHYPDGTLSIERTAADRNGPVPGGWGVDDPARDGGDGGESVVDEPVMMITRRMDATPGQPPMSFPLGAATSVEFTGERYLHAWVMQDFKGDALHRHAIQPPQRSGYNLVARARQFSSFLLLVGNVGPNSFLPRHAIIVQNKDEAILPLLVEPLPTPKEFRDAIGSLSPEQRRFATAFRNMQLESSVFGVLVVQLKPQLEAVLGLPDDSLTKEIRLTQDLLSLFIDYQIPSDLLTYDGDDDASVAEKVSRVKSHVAAVKEMIEDAKAKEVEDAKKEAELKKQKMMHEKMHLYEDAEESVVYATSANMRGDMMAETMLHDAMAGESGARAQGRRKLHARMAPMMMADGMASSDLGKANLRADGESARMRHGEPPPQEPVDRRTGTEEPTPVTGSDGNNSVDFTLIPKQLDAKLEELDEDSSLRPSKIKTGSAWTKRMQKSLLSPPQTIELGADEQKKEKNKAFDLLDALSKSGALRLEYAELHVVIACTHQFDKSIIATVVEDNVNPIEKMERSLMIVSSTINGLPPMELLNEAQVEAAAKHSPKLLELEVKNGDKKIQSHNKGEAEA